MRDPKIERFLDKHGVPWEYIDSPVPFDEIDVERSRHNRARREPLNQDDVARYVIALVEGSPFPALVGYRGPSGYVLMTGNHREQAGRDAGLAAWPHGFYEVKSDNQFKLELLTVRLNDLEGVAPRLSERVALAVDFVQRHGMSQESAAVEFGLPRDLIGRTMRASDTRARLAAAHMKPDGLSDGTLVALARLPNEPVFAKVAQVVRQQNLGSTKTENLVRDVLQARSESEQLRVADSWRHPARRRASAEGQTVQAPTRRRQRFFDWLRSLNQYADRHPTAVANQLQTPEHVAEARALFNAFLPKMERILGPAARDRAEDRPAQAITRPISGYGQPVAREAVLASGARHSVD